VEKEARMGTERERIRETIINMAKGKEAGQKLLYDRDSKSIRPESNTTDPDNTISITPEDNIFGGIIPDSGSIVISGELLGKMAATATSHRAFFACRDQGDVYTLFEEGNMSGSVPGTILWENARSAFHISTVGESDDCVRVIISSPPEQAEEPGSGSSIALGYIRFEEKWRQAKVQIVPVRSRIYSRAEGIYETDALAGKRVLVIGLGSFGSYIVLEMSKSGIANFGLMDHERLEVENIMRHVAGISDVGRYKTKVMAEKIHDKNPYANVRIRTEEVYWENFETVRELVKLADIVICTTDDNPSKLIINRLCVEENTPCIFAGAFRRAYGGQVLFVRPGVSLCYQCFLMLLPEQANDMEISSRAQAKKMGYTDRPVPIEPGLSNDIAPICNMVVKLTIQALLNGSQTTLRSLDDDLVASWYIFLNRREPGTQYENLGPLEFNMDGFRILRWYGIDVKPDEDCPVCGDFNRHLSKQEGIQLKVVAA